MTYGNISNKKTLLRNITEVRESLNISQKIYHIADSALCSAENVQTLGAHSYWIICVPETIKEALTIFSTEVEWTSCIDTKYKYVPFLSKYRNVDQRWILFYSDVQHHAKIERDQQKLNEKLATDQISLNKSLVKGFACETNARLTVERWLSKHKRYLISDIIITEENRKPSGKCGRLKRDEVLKKWYHISVIFLSIRKWCVINRNSWEGSFSQVMIYQ